MASSIYLDILQLLFGWGVLLAATASLSLVPNAGLLWKLTDGVASNSTSVSTSASVIFGAWVLAEFMLLVLLVTMATVLMYCCRKTKPTVGLLQVIADPVLVPLACVPVLLMCGVPVARSLRICLRHLHSNASTTPCPYGNHLHWDLSTDNADRIWGYEHELMTLECCLQCFVVLPVVLRFLHLRWRMNLQPFLLTALLLLFHACDVSILVRLALVMTTEAGHRSAEALACLSALFISALSLTVATPPVYLGGDLTEAYVRWLHVGTTLVIDLPGLAMKLHVLSSSEALLVPNVDALFFICLLKNVCDITVLFLIIIKRLKGQRSRQYASLQGGRKRSASVCSSSDTQRLCSQTDHEDFV
ncbi:hypothetical protein CAPTEDRAFT_195842 [Capitella teleta]|uniref:Uncharacterized protein n=1 Tax=Capitella teleta TaxID=283909 RepID=R7UKB0_CAPTE|nr:hypothetical protein CAPTEDRAFT_195842 [Capitella teleta]|eukprot:ELU03717.1 hypothetical protein CAPTEDRAFT_195842 [Capitella teleta]